MCVCDRRRGGLRVPNEIVMLSFGIQNAIVTTPTNSNLHSVTVESLSTNVANFQKFFMCI